MPLILHLGADCAIPRRHILAILDVRCAEGADARAFLQRARQRHAVTEVPEGPPRSLVIAVDDAGIQRVYLSPISPLTLARRESF